MSTLEIDVGDIRPVSVSFTDDELGVARADGRKIATPLAWYPRLKNASAAARAHFELMAMGIHWPELDEDLGVAGMLKGRSASCPSRARDKHRSSASQETKHSAP